MGIVLTRGKHLHDSIIIPRGDVRAHNTLTLLLIIEVTVVSERSERSCIFMSCISILPLFLRFFAWILELSRQCDIFFFLYIMLKCLP